MFADLSDVRILTSPNRSLASTCRALALSAAFPLLPLVLMAPGSAWADFCDIPHAGPAKPPIRVPNGSAPPPSPPPIRVVDHACVAMSKLGCESITHQRDVWACKTEAATLACQALQKQGKLKQCGGPGLPSAEKYAEQAVGALGCKNLVGKVGEPLCHTEEAIETCQALHAAGYLKKCHP